MRALTVFRCAALAACVGLASPAFGISNGQLDTFTDFTTQAWEGGGGSPVNNPTDGADGAADPYLRINAFGGGGPGSKLAAFNSAQWGGDYLAAGVTAVQMDMRNQSTFDFEMRIMLFGDGGQFTSTSTTLVPADNQWHTFVFSLDSGDLTAVGGIGDYASTISTVGRLLLRHQTGAPAGPGTAPSVIAELGVDNILAIPAPGAVTLMMLGMAGAARRRRA